MSDQPEKVTNRQAAEQLNAAIVQAVGQVVGAIERDSLPSAKTWADVAETLARARQTFNVSV